MDSLRRQISGLATGPAAAAVADRSKITRLEIMIVVLNFAGVLGLLVGIVQVFLVTSGMSRRVAVVAANADRLGEGQSLQPIRRSGDEIGQLARSVTRAEQLLASRAAELTAARDEALRATQEKSRFLSRTSHELRTPLNSILGFTQLLRMSDLSDEDHDATERIIGAGRHLLVLINELIDIARIESGEINLSLEPVPVAALIEEVSQLIGPLAAERLITITGDCQRPVLAARADRQRVSQVLLNLVSNAVKYCHRGGTITISCRQDAESASVIVSDTGPGLTQADLERIFVPFERLDAEQAGIEGTGIGLPLSRTLTEAMGGQLSASSVPGQGSAFTVSLPRAADLTHVPPADTAVAVLPGPRSPALTALSILYIEDQPANIEVITRLLRRRPNTTLLTAPSGREGIQSVIRAVPDVILLDLDLPDIPGEHVLSELRAAPSTAAIPVVILSADAGPAVIRRLLAAGAFAYLTKPLDLAQLSVLLDSLAAPARQPHPRNGTAVTSATRGMPGLRRGASLPPGGADPANRVVLYIEDDQSNATLVAKLLTRRPHTELHIAVTARDGVQAAIDRQPALILLDNHLPDATGAEILRKLASAQPTATIPVIIISGDSGIGAAGELRAAGAAGFLAKPYDIHQFLAIIDRYLPA